MSNIMSCGVEFISEVRFRGQLFEIEGIKELYGHVAVVEFQ